MKKRVVSLLLCLIMALSLIPTAAFATEVETLSDDFAVQAKPINPPSESYFHSKDKFGYDAWTRNGSLTGLRSVKVGDTTLTKGNASSTTGAAVNNGIKVSLEPGYYIENYKYVCFDKYGCESDDKNYVHPGGAVKPDEDSSVTLQPGKKDFGHSSRKGPYWLLLKLAEDTTEYTVTYNWGDLSGKMNTGVPTDNKGYKVNAKVTVLGPSDDAIAEAKALGYTFAGWKADFDDSTSYLKDNQFYMPRKSVTLTAQWKAIPAPTTGTLTITKNVVGLPFNEIPAKEFTYSLPDSTELLTLTVAENTSGAITATGSKTLNIGRYEITETCEDNQVNGYTLTTTYTVNGTAVDSLDDVAIEGNKTTTVVITDTYTQDEDVNVRIPIAKKVTVAQGSFHPTDATMPDFEFVAKVGDQEVGRTNLAPAEDETTYEWAATGDLMVSIPAKNFVNGTATVTITEVLGDAAHWTYDASSYTVEVKENATYTIKKGNGAADEIVFNNTYDKPYGVLTIVKKLDGAVADQDMTFYFKATTGNKTYDNIPVEVAEGQSSGYVNFMFDPGEYTITEVTCQETPYGYKWADCDIDYGGEDANSVTVEAHKHATVTVTNKYEKLPAATGTITIVKKVTVANGSIQPTDATMPTFQFVAKVGNTQVGNLSLKPVKDASGNWTIRGEMDITIPYELFDKENNYKATVIISEVAGNATGWTYDTKTYALDLYYDTSDYGPQNAPEEIVPDDTYTFVNGYNYTYTPVTPPITPIRRQPTTTTKPVQSVKTGDMGIALYAVTSLLSLGGTALVIKKRKDEE